LPPYWIYRTFSTEEKALMAKEYFWRNYKDLKHRLNKTKEDEKLLSICLFAYKNKD